MNGTNRTNAWTFDPLYRLKQKTISGGTSGTLSYGFDPVCNRTSRTITGSLSLTNQSFTFNTNDWLTSDGYDNNGNTTNSSGNAYQYDALNHLTNMNNGAVLITYNGDGSRVKKMVGSTTTYYLLDDQNPTGYAQVLEEWTASGSTTNLSRVYNYGLQLISQRQPSVSTNYFVFDGHGSTRVLADTGGNVVNAFTFDAYGNLIASNAAPQTLYLYAGEQFDPDLGSYYLRARTYNPGTGRFPTMDDHEGYQEDPKSLNRYTYAHADPVNGIDPSGHEIEFDAAKGRLVHEKFYPFALTALGVLKYKDTPIGTAVPSLAGRPGSLVRPDIIGIGNGTKTWFELKPISHKNSKRTDGTITTLTTYGVLLVQAGVQPGIPQTLVPQNFRLGNIIDPVGGQRLQVWLEAGDVPGLIYYYFKKDNDDDDGDRVPIYLPVLIVLPEYNSASRAISLTGGRAAIAARSVGLTATAGIALYVGIATINAMQGAP